METQIGRRGALRSPRRHIAARCPCLRLRAMSAAL